MAWFLFALLGAALSASYYGLTKKFLAEVDRYILAAGSFLTTSALLLIVSLIRGVPQISAGFHSAVLATGVLNVVAVFLYYRALETTDLSLAVPMIAFTPVFLVLTSFLMLGELPTLLGTVGIVLVVLGSYTINVSRDSRGLFAPFKKIFENRGLVYMLIVAFLYSLSSNFDKLVVQHSDPVFASAATYGFFGLAFIPIAVYKSDRPFTALGDSYHKLFLVGLVLAVMAVAINVAYTISIVPYVIAIKRTSILFSVAFGGYFFREGNMLQRGIGALFMTAGAALIILF